MQTADGFFSNHNGGIRQRHPPGIPPDSPLPGNSGMQEYPPDASGKSLPAYRWDLPLRKGSTPWHRFPPVPAGSLLQSLLHRLQTASPPEHHCSIQRSDSDYTASAHGSFPAVHQADSDAYGQVPLSHSFPEVPCIKQPCLLPLPPQSPVPVLLHPDFPHPQKILFHIKQHRRRAFAFPPAACPETSG